MVSDEISFEEALNRLLLDVMNCLQRNKCNFSHVMPDLYIYLYIYLHLKNKNKCSSNLGKNDKNIY